MQEHNERDRGRSSYGRLWRIGVLAARHRVQGAAASAVYGALARRRCSIVPKAQRMRQAAAYRRNGSVEL